MTKPLARVPKKDIKILKSTKTVCAVLTMMLDARYISYGKHVIVVQCLVSNDLPERFKKKNRSLFLCEAFTIALARIEFIHRHSQGIFTTTAQVINLK
jgi:hypothetical protein